MFRAPLLALALSLASIPAGAEQIRMFTRGDQSLAAHLIALRNAQSSIDIRSYEFQPCDVSTKMLIAVLAEKARTIPVRVMVDAHTISSEQRQGLADYFASRNIQFRVYNTSWLSDHRSHIKLYLIDGGSKNPVYFADGSNTSDQYFGMSAKKNFVNRDFMISGPSGRQAHRAFAAHWKSSIVSVPRPASDGSAFFNSCLRANKRDFQVNAYMNKNAAELARVPEVSCDKVTYLTDSPEFLNGEHWNRDLENSEEFMNPQRLRHKQVTAGILSFINGTKRSLNMENQYYLPAYQLRTAFENLRARGVPVLILTNRTSDASMGFTGVMSQMVLRASRRDSKGSMMVLPVSSLGRLRAPHGLTPARTPWHLHSKTAVRDHKDVFITSFNLDPRSYHTNLEYGVVVSNCSTLARLIEDDYKRMATAYMQDLSKCAACQREIPHVNPLQIILGYLTGSFL